MLPSSLYIQQFQQFFFAHARKLCAVAANNLIGEVFFGLLKLFDLFFDCIFRNQFINRYFFRLTDTMCAVGCLVLYGLIPLRVIVDDHVCSRQVQTDPSGFQ